MPTHTDLRRRCERLYVRILTWCWSVKCATSKLSSQRCASRKPGTLPSQRCTQIQQLLRSTASSTYFLPISRHRFVRSSLWCWKEFFVRHSCRELKEVDVRWRSRSSYPMALFAI